MCEQRQNVADPMSSKEKRATLSLLLQQLRGETVAVRTKDGQCIEGTLLEASADLTLTVRERGRGAGDRRAAKGGQEEGELGVVVILGSRVVTVDLPPEADVGELLDRGVQRSRPLREAYREAKERRSKAPA